jgi:hypothetical protein
MGEVDCAGAAGGGLPPRSFPGSVPRPEQLEFDFVPLGPSVLLALPFLVLAAFPGQLLNKT